MDSTIAAPASRGDVDEISLVRIFLLEARMEFLRLLRLPSFSVPTVAFPILFYLLFGIALYDHHAVPAIAREILARFTVFGVMAPALFGFGITVALDRDRGLLHLKRALPMPHGAYLAVKLLMTLIFAALVSAALMLLVVTAGHVAVLLVQCCAQFIVAVLGAVPFCGLGLLIPLHVLPHFLGQLAPLMPAFHMARIAVAAVGASEDGHPGLDLLTLAAIAAGFFAVARWRFRKLG